MGGAADYLLTVLTVDELSRNHRSGVLMDFPTALSGLMSILSPLWAGVVYDRLIPDAPYWTSAAVFVVAAIILT